MSSKIARSQSNRALWCGVIGDLHHWCAADKSAAVVQIAINSIWTKISGVFAETCTTKNLGITEGKKGPKHY